jgi:hypothetical protein
MIKSLDTKLADIRANPSGSKAFIIADAKDADMAFGIADLGLYSITFTNNLDEEHQALREFQDFRLESERIGSV